GGGLREPLLGPARDLGAPARASLHRRSGRSSRPRTDSRPSPPLARPGPRKRNAAGMTKPLSTWWSTLALAASLLVLAGCGGSQTSHTGPGTNGAATPPQLPSTPD